ncbi:Cathepsin O, partial [Stylophora pistillata]
MSTFQQSLERHAKLNARELELNGTAVYGINQFSDWTPEEFRGFLKRGIQEDHVLFANDAMTPSGCCTLELNSSNTPPNRDWAFTATECVESQWAIHYNHQSTTDLSVQELISCSRSKGCSGGSTLLAFNWLQTK